MRKKSSIHVRGIYLKSFRTVWTPGEYSPQSRWDKGCYYGSLYFNALYELVLPEGMTLQ